MKKQELIERIDGLKNIFGNKCEYVKIDLMIELVSELDEPQKVKVPQYIADKIEYCKESGDWDLFQSMDYCFNFRECSSWLEFKNNQETFARAWLDGYEVEKEKRYLVKVKGICGNHETLNREKHSNKWLFSDREENSLYGTHHTRKELEDADFGEVFNSPLFEVEEVE